MPDIRHKTLDIEQARLKSADAEAGTFEMYASTWEPWDRAGEKPAQGSFAAHLDAFVTGGAILVGHDWGMVPVAYILDAQEDAVGLLVKCAWHTTEDAQEVRKVVSERLAAGKGVSVSIGYILHDAKAVDEGLLLTDIELVEVSIVLRPCNPAARVISAKDAPPEAATFADHSSAVLGAVQGLIERARGIDALRREKGRTLGQEARDRLSELKAALSEAEGDLETLLAEPPVSLDVAPPAARDASLGDDAGADVLARYMRLLAHLAGVHL